MKALSIHGLTKIYPNGVQALNGIDLDVEAGDFFALLGPNGAGKTTAIGIITSLVNKTGGTVRVFGHDIDSDLAAAKSCIGVVPQEINLNQWETVYNCVVNVAGFYGLPRKRAKQRAETCLRELQLWDRRDEASRNLSGGMKRRLMIARALVHEPKLLILDEPTAGVDIEIRRSMWDFLRHINEQGTTIILTTHYLEEAESLCRHVAIIDEGRIAEHARMSTVLRKLHQEVFVLSLVDELQPDMHINGFAYMAINDHEIEVEVASGQNLNQLFAALSDAGIAVSSMRNKTNRLEELFMRLVDRRDKERTKQLADPEICV
ncbi:MAG: ABC transporter ATP-binding protein [Gammaproteobacteria bacterium]|nr:ABC transporter ATP-binding protein [Gammaproteobacteria bacterium]MCP4091656.1 ABC transporter ATP-binding protein [Gammaproteobacteria bacterium]MCP4276152.1 ABC transporter ATP-binding protein [Gammaproteobacteria bacterium]MCP4831786.1 ABC transporter ATP-binding protein [Gammaproteobacteria bacterium]MCP4929722.1 ABC transporter ATP-binding protein [Gammaproteobacteria bacterium]